MALDISPPLVNSAGPWATTEEDLKALYECPYIGAVTTRTSVLFGFKHDEAVNQNTFYDARTNSSMHERSPNANSSLNTLGYSPFALDDYLRMVESTVARAPSSIKKPFIVSVTGTPADIGPCFQKISEHSAKTSIPLSMEINLSCPNIPGQPPPTYSGYALQGYLSALQRATANNSRPFDVPIRVGIKTSPFTYQDQFIALIDALLATTGGGLRCPVDFITATNTLGNCLVMIESDEASGFSPAVSSAAGNGIGGAGGAAIHAISLGNVCTLRNLLDQHDGLRHIEIVGCGGVSDYTGFGRMQSAGASVVAVGTACHKEGNEVFHKIANELAVAGKTVGKR